MEPVIAAPLVAAGPAGVVAAPTFPAALPAPAIVAPAAAAASVQAAAAFPAAPPRGASERMAFLFQVQRDWIPDLFSESLRGQLDLSQLLGEYDKAAAVLDAIPDFAAAPARKLQHMSLRPGGAVERGRIQFTDEESGRFIEELRTPSVGGDTGALARLLGAGHSSPRRLFMREAARLPPELRPAYGRAKPEERLRLLEPYWSGGEPFAAFSQRARAAVTREREILDATTPWIFERLRRRLEGPEGSDRPALLADYFSRDALRDSFAALKRELSPEPETRRRRSTDRFEGDLADLWAERALSRGHWGKESGESETIDLIEAPPSLGIFRGCVGQDCSSARDFATALDPQERIFLIRGERRGLLGYLSGTMESDEANSSLLHVKVVNGPRLKRRDVAMILEGLHRARRELGADELVLPSRDAVAGLTNYSATKDVYKEQIAREPNPKSVHYKNAHVRKAIETLDSPLMDGTHNRMDRNAAATTYTPEASFDLSFGVRPLVFGRGVGEAGAVPKGWVVDLLAAYKVFSPGSSVAASLEALGIAEAELDSRVIELSGNSSGSMPGLPELYEVGRFSAADADRGEPGFEAAFRLAGRHIERLMFSFPLSQFLQRNIEAVNQSPEMGEALRRLARGPHRALQTLAQVANVGDREGRSIAVPQDAYGALLRRLPDATMNEAMHIVSILSGNKFGQLAVVPTTMDERELFLRTLGHDDPAARAFAAMGLLKSGDPAVPESALRGLAGFLTGEADSPFRPLQFGFVLREDATAARRVQPFLEEIMNDAARKEEVRNRALWRLLSYEPDNARYHEMAWNFYRELSSPVLRTRFEDEFHFLEADSPLRRFLAERGYAFPAPPPVPGEVVVSVPEVVPVQELPRR